MEDRFTLHTNKPLDEMSTLEIFIIFRKGATEHGRDYAKIVGTINFLVLLDRKEMYEAIDKICNVVYDK